MKSRKHSCLPIFLVIMLLTISKEDAVVSAVESSLPIQPVANKKNISNQYEYNDGEKYADWNFDLDVPVHRRKLSVLVNSTKAEKQVAENNLQIITQQFDLRLREQLGNYLENCFY